MRTDTIISFCGDICSECPRYLATRNNDIKKLEDIAKLWYRLGFRDRIVNPEDLKCTGCSRDKICSQNLNKCEHLKSIDNCGECNLYPCDKISSVFQISERADELCKKQCSGDEYEELFRAFFNKKQILTEINERSNNKCN